MSLKSLQSTDRRKITILAIEFAGFILPFPFKDWLYLRDCIMWQLITAIFKFQILSNDCSYSPGTCVSMIRSQRQIIWSSILKKKAHTRLSLFSSFLRLTPPLPLNMSFLCNNTLLLSFTIYTGTFCLYNPRRFNDREMTPNWNFILKLNRVRSTSYKSSNSHKQINKKKMESYYIRPLCLRLGKCNLPIQKHYKQGTLNF